MAELLAAVDVGRKVNVEARMDSVAAVAAAYKGSVRPVFVAAALQP